MSFDFSAASALLGATGAAVGVLITALEARGKERTSAASLKAARRLAETPKRSRPDTRHEAVSNAEESMNELRGIAIADYAADREVREDVDGALRSAMEQLRRFPTQRDT